MSVRDPGLGLRWGGFAPTQVLWQVGSCDPREPSIFREPSEIFRDACALGINSSSQLKSRVRAVDRVRESLVKSRGVGANALGFHVHGLGVPAEQEWSGATS